MFTIHTQCYGNVMMMRKLIGTNGKKYINLKLMPEWWGQGKLKTIGAVYRFEIRGSVHRSYGII